MAYSEEVDTLRRAKSEGKDWLAKLESEEREKTGIKNTEDQVQQSVWILSGSDEFI
jgi:DNA mismatch repair protein MutS